MSMFATLITGLSSTCFHYRCAALLILTSTVPGVNRVTTGIGQNWVKRFNDLVSPDFEWPLVTWGPRTLSFQSRPCLMFLQALYLPSVTSKLFGYMYIRSCDVRILLFIGCFGLSSDWQISEVVTLNPSFTMFSSKINFRDWILKEFSFVYFKAFQCPENTETVVYVHYFSPDRPKITKGSIVDLS